MLLTIRAGDVDHLEEQEEEEEDDADEEEEAEEDVEHLNPKSQNRFPQIGTHHAPPADIGANFHP